MFDYSSFYQQHHKKLYVFHFVCFMKEGAHESKSAQGSWMSSFSPGGSSTTPPLYWLSNFCFLSLRILALGTFLLKTQPAGCDKPKLNGKVILVNGLSWALRCQLVFSQPRERAILNVQHSWAFKWHQSSHSQIEPDERLSLANLTQNTAKGNNNMKF